MTEFVSAQDAPSAISEKDRLQLNITDACKIKDTNKRIGVLRDKAGKSVFNETADELNLQCNLQHLYDEATIPFVLYKDYLTFGLEIYSAPAGCATSAPCRSFDVNPNRPSCSLCSKFRVYYGRLGGDQADDFRKIRDGIAGDYCKDLSDANCKKRINRLIFDNDLQLREAQLSQNKARADLVSAEEDEYVRIDVKQGDAPTAGSGRGNANKELYKSGLLRNFFAMMNPASQPGQSPAAQNRALYSYSIDAKTFRADEAEVNETQGFQPAAVQKEEIENKRIASNLKLEEGLEVAVKKPDGSTTVNRNLENAYKNANRDGKLARSFSKDSRDTEKTLRDKAARGEKNEFVLNRSKWNYKLFRLVMEHYNYATADLMKTRKGRANLDLARDGLSDPNPEEQLGVPQLIDPASRPRPGARTPSTQKQEPALDDGLMKKLEPTNSPGNPSELIDGTIN